MGAVEQREVTRVVNDVISLLGEHYVDPDAAAAISRTMAASLAGGRYPADEQTLAAAVTEDLQQLKRATIVGERTRGGAHAREGFRVHPHLEATISVARAVNPVTGTNWEGTGVTPDVEVPADQARDWAHRHATERLAVASA